VLTPKPIYLISCREARTQCEHVEPIATCECGFYHINHRHVTQSVNFTRFL